MDLQPWAPYLGIIQIILAVVLTVLVVMQAKGGSLDGLLGGGGSSDTGGFRTRRGVEETIFRMTIIVGALFFVNTLLAFLAWG